MIREKIGRQAMKNVRTKGTCTNYIMDYECKHVIVLRSDVMPPARQQYYIDVFDTRQRRRKKCGQKFKSTCDGIINKLLVLINI